MSDRTAQEAVAGNPHWYHSIEVAPGVVTPGQVDLRATAAKVLPRELSGTRALDVGTFDGFWAFELESRRAEVVALDLPKVVAAEWPPVNRAVLEQRAEEWDVKLGRGFRIASELLGSQVERVEGDVYSLTPELIGGPVQTVFSGAILLHLRDPVRALERMASVLAPGGRLIVLEPFSIAATLRAPRRPLAEFQPLRFEFNWWYPNLATLRHWLGTAGFEDIQRTGFHRPPSTPAMRIWMCSLEAGRPV